jgi:hypothetical protein
MQARKLVQTIKCSLVRKHEVQKTQIDIKYIYKCWLWYTFPSSSLTLFSSLSRLLTWQLEHLLHQSIMHIIQFDERTTETPFTTSSDPFTRSWDSVLCTASGNVFAWLGDKTTSPVGLNVSMLGTFASCSFRYRSPPCQLAVQCFYPAFVPFRVCDSLLICCHDPACTLLTRR